MSTTTKTNPNATEVAHDRRVGPRATVVLMFQPRFVPLVESGEKCRTIRPIRKRLVKVGDPVSLRQWTGKPYASKQRVLREGTVTKVTSIYLGYGFTAIGGKELSYAAEMKLAKADGFDSGQEFRNWFLGTHGLPFEGTMIEWANTELSHG